MSLKINKPLPLELLDTAIIDKNNRYISIGEIIKQTPTLIVFIRHFGCFSCSKQMIELSPRLNQIKQLGINIIAIGNGNAMFIEGFKERLKLEGKPIEIYTDPSLKTFKLAQLQRSIWKVMSPLTMWQYLKALSTGIKNEKQQGDNYQLGGTVFIDEKGIVQYYFQNKNVSGYADQNQVMEAIQKYVITTQLK